MKSSESKLDLFLESYILYRTAVEKAQKEFDDKPCKKTATELSNLKNKYFTNEEKFKPEVLLEWRKYSE